MLKAILFAAVLFLIGKTGSDILFDLFFGGKNKVGIVLFSFCVDEI